MMYNNKLAIAIKTNGKVLREFGDEVRLPFGSEYSIFVKNMNTVRALVSIEIDGDDVGDGAEFVVCPGDSLDIERFLRNGNLKEGNKFKFIERTSNIEDHRGIGVEDGLIRVEFKYETPITSSWVFYTEDNYKHDDSWKRPQTPWKTGYPLTSDPTIIYDGTSGFVGSVSTTLTNSCGEEGATLNHVEAKQVSDVGITVPGSVSDQKFRTVSSFPTEDKSHVIVLKLLGQTEGNVQVIKPVTVKMKPTCVTCGRKNKATAKFCTECGTALQIVA
jgi:hypothetical protein